MNEKEKVSQKVAYRELRNPEIFTARTVMILSERKKSHVGKLEFIPISDFLYGNIHPVWARSRADAGAQKGSLNSNLGSKSVPKGF